MTVIVGVDGSGRTHRLGQFAVAAARPVVRADDPAEPPEALARRLAAAAGQDAVVLVDDAHRLPGPLQTCLARAARNGLALVVARRPSVDTPELAELDEAAGVNGVERLEPLDETAVAAVILEATGRPAAGRLAAELRAAADGLPALVVLLAGAPPGPPPPALVARTQRRLAWLGHPADVLARVLSLGLRLDDAVLATTTGGQPAEVAAALRGLRDAGLLAADGQLIPAVAAAVRADLPPAELRRLQEAAGNGLLAGNDPVAAAEQLGAAGSGTPMAVRAYVGAAQRLRFTDPEAAVGWYDRALAAGADAGPLTVGRAEAAAQLGMPIDLDIVGSDPADRQRLALVRGAVAAHQGRPGRAADALLEAATPGPLLAVPLLVAIGRAAEVTTADGPPSLRLFADAVSSVGEPASALPLLIEAAEAAERSDYDVVLPETPHAVGALAAVTAGDVATAERLLSQAVATGVGGPVGVQRHRLLLAWARLRSGRLDTANAELSQLTGVELGGRERALAAAVSAGVARRTGDVARQRAAWAQVEPVLAREAFDLLQVEAWEELLVAAARVRARERVDAALHQLDAMLDRWGRPSAWAASLAWLRLQIAVVAEDGDGAAAAAEAFGQPDGVRQRAKAEAATQWSRVLAGKVDQDAVLAAADGLSVGQLPWEASRLAGNAAIRIGDATVARGLLERARELTGGEVPGKTGRGQLSEREAEVGRLVLAGRTHREIGAQLYVSPKTVEHHVARIRAKLGATSRAELQAALRSVLDEE